MGQSHMIVMLLGMAILLQLFSEFCELSHLSRYSKDGKGLRWRYSWFPGDFLAEVFQQMSELIISFVLISLGFGWTLIDVSETESIGLGTSIYQLRKFISKFTTLSPATLFAVAQAIIQVVLEMLGRKYDDDFNQFHDHEHWPGYTLMLLRIVLCVVFNTAILKLCGVSQDTSLKGFLFKLQIAGSIWYLAFPLAVFVSALLPAYKRHSLVTMAAILVQSFALVSLVFLFFYEGEYFKISSLSKMGGVFGGAAPAAGKSGSTVKGLMKKIATD